MTQLNTLPARRRTAPKSRLFIALLFFLLIAGLAGRWIYQFQKQRNTSALLTEAREAEKNGDLKSAASSYRRYLRREPSDMAVLRDYANLLYERAKRSPEVLADTIQTFQRLVGLDPTDTNAINKLAVLCLLVREFQTAEELAGKWKQLDPTSTDARLTLARSQLGQSRAQDAIQTLNTALNEVTPSAIYPLLVETLTRTPNRQDEALRRLDEGLNATPDDPALQISAFLLYRAREDSTRAVEYLRRAVSLGETSLPVLLTAAQYFVGESLFADADGVLKKAAQIAPDDRRILLLQARCLNDLKNTDAFISLAKQLEVRAESKDAELLVQAADLFQKANLADDAERCLKLVDTLPEAGETYAASASILRAKREMLAGNWRQATSLLRSAIERDAANVTAMRALSRCYLLTGDLDAADETCRQLVAVAPGDWEVRLTLADIAWSQRRFADARSAVSGFQISNDTLRTASELIAQTAELALRSDSLEQQKHAPVLPASIGPAMQLAQNYQSVAVWVMRAFAITGQWDKVLETRRLHPPSSTGNDQLDSELTRLYLAYAPSDAAISLANEILARNPNSIDGNRLKILALDKSDQIGEAATYVASASLPAETKTILSETLADCYARRQMSKEALDQYHKLADANPKAVSARLKIIQLTTDLNEASKRRDEIGNADPDSVLRAKFEFARAILRLNTPDRGPAEAVTLLQDCLAKRPRWTSARATLGRAFAMQKQWYDALEAYRTALAQQPGLLASPLGIHVVELLTQMGRLAEAQSMLNTLTAALPQDPRVLVLWMDQQIRSRDYQSAQSTAQQLWRIQPGNAVWPALQADLQLRLGQPTEAERIAARALETDPNSIPLTLAWARALIAQQRQQEAIDRVEAMAQKKNEVPYALLFANILVLSGRESAASAEVERAQSLAGNDPSQWASCSDFWGRLNRRDRQLETARKVVQLRNEDPGESLAIAGILADARNEKDWSEAMAIVRRRLEKQPHDLPAMIMAAQLEMSGMPPDLASAEGRLEKVLVTDPLRTDARIVLSTLQLAQGRPEAARSTLRVGLAVAPDSPELLLASAKLQLTIRDYEGAIASASHLLTIQPRSLSAVQLLASAYDRSGQASVGLRIIRDRVPETTATAEERIVIAALNESAGNPQRAEEVLRQAMRNNPNHAGVIRSLILTLARRGEIAAIQSLADERRQQAPEDFDSLIVAAGAMSCSCKEPEYRRRGEEWISELASKKPEIAPDMYYRSARCFYECGDHDQAARRFAEALKLNALHRESTNDLAWLLAEDMGKPADAIAVIDRFVAAGGKEDGHLFDTQGLILLRLGRTEQAEQALNSSLRIADSPVTRTFATYHLALLNAQANRKKEAEMYARQALSLHTEFGGLNDKQREDCTSILGTTTSNSTTTTKPAAQKND